MTADLRKLFEIELHNYLKANFVCVSNIKCLKNEIFIKKDNKASGHIDFDFLNNTRGYCHCTSVNSPESIDFFNKINHYQYNAAGQLQSYTDPAGLTTRYRRDLRGLVHTRINGFSYDAYGRLSALTNENGEQYRFQYDAGDCLTEVRIEQLNHSERYGYVYDALSRRIEKHRPSASCTLCF